MAKEKKSIWLRIIAVLVLSVLCIGVILHPVIADGGTERFTITCSTGDGIYTPDGMSDYPLQISVRNNGGDFNGVIKLMMYTGSDMSEVVAYVQTASIMSGKTAYFKFKVKNVYFDCSSYVIPVRVELLDENGNQVCSQVLNFQAVLDGTATIIGGVISRNNQISQLMGASGFDYDTEYIYGRVTMWGKDMTPEDIMATDMSRIGMLVMDMDVADEAWEKISDWLIAGGHLMINRTVYHTRIGKTLSEDETAEWGTGRILVYDEEDPWSAAMLIRSVKTLYGEAGLNELLGGEGDSYWTISSQLGYDMWSRVPGISGYLIVLIVYILLMGPAAYILLSKQKDRREYLWGVIPCLAVIFSFIIYQMGSPTRYEDTFIRYGSIVDLTDEGIVEKTNILVTSPDKGHTMVTLEGACDLVPLFEDYYWSNDRNLERSLTKLRPEDYDLAITASEEKTEVLINSSRVFDKCYLSVSRILESNGKLSADLQFYRGCFSGTVTNATPWNLKNAFILYRGVGLLLGDLPAGQSMTLDQAEADIIPIYSGSLSFDSSVFGENANQTAAEWIMKNLADNIGLNRDNSSSAVIGFTEEYDIGIEESSQIESVNGMALVMSNIAVTASGSGWSSQALVQGTGVSDEDEMNYDTFNYMLYGSEVINLNYQLDGTLRPEYMKWLNHDQYVHLEFYNNETGSYDKVFVASYVMDGNDLAPYLDEHYQIKARVQGDDMGDNRYIPAFTVTGGEVRD